jgi:hypothetical protein
VKGTNGNQFEYEITRHPATAFKNLAYFCSEQGECSLDEVSMDQTSVLSEILNHQGQKGWELVQIAFAKTGILAFWKRPVGYAVDLK